MAPRTQPSERQRRLGAELRKLRLRAGISGSRAAEILDADRARISNIEAGRIDVSRNRLYKVLREYGCPDGPYFDALMEMAQSRGVGWWDEFRDVMRRQALDLAEMESRAASIRVHEPLAIPGMFQTEDYAHAVMQAVSPDMGPTDRFVQFRMARQRVLTCEAPLPYHAVIHEAALRVRVGGPQVMRKQLRKLIEVARLPNVTVQVFPFERGAYPAFSRPFVLFGGSTGELDTVYLEHSLKIVFLGDGADVDDYSKMFERLSDLALDPVDPEAAPESHIGRDSLSLIQHAMYEL
ncbi:helix-turn-helix domain-containing protein [Streptomyces gilvosporeus]|uniref:Transcriptional regulator n=1 Tax=Streptomyces gilvosporeus TaxID=553510 RepID=A0A1V0TRT7_9ACTN|nr:helix-turn-helix transcriptional regulator [Streptomyces gilvosporeus]ARF55627.1 transcriptional regulator [Streptomyces gilvosporeus]